MKQLLHLMIHSLYSNEIFLRELISNASDACDKLRFEALNNRPCSMGDSDFWIRLAFDHARTMTIADNGVGMNPRGSDRQPRHHRQVRHPRVLLGADRRPAEGRPPDRPVRRRLYSSFIVADKVTVVTRAGQNKDQACAGNRRRGRFLIEMVDKAARHRRHLHLRDGEDDPRWLEDESPSSEVFRPHQPIVMKKGTRKDGEQVETDEDETVNQASACGRSKSRSATSSTGVLQARRPRLRGPAGMDARPRRGQDGIHATALHPGARAVRHVRTATPATASSSTCAASSSWTTPSS